jgi:hypothetical protein
MRRRSLRSFEYVETSPNFKNRVEFKFPAIESFQNNEALQIKHTQRRKRSHVRCKRQRWQAMVVVKLIQHRRRHKKGSSAESGADE